MLSRDRAARGAAGSAGRTRGLVLVALVAALPLGACSKKKSESAAAPSASAPSGPKQLSPELAAKTLAKVGDRTITLGDYAAALERMDSFERMRYQSPDRRKRLLDEMVEVELLAQEAKRRGLDKTEETQERVRQVLRDQLVEDLRKNAPAANDIQDAELHAYYDAHKDEFAEPERRRVSAIVLDTAAAAKPVLAKALKASPTEWGALVDQFSTQRGARTLPNAPPELAGDLGIVGPPNNPRGANPRVPDPVREAAFKVANVGDTFPTVVEADKKFYVLRVTSKTDSRERSFEEAQRAIRTAVVQSHVDEQQKALEKDLRQRFPVKVDDAALEKMPMPPPSAAPSTIAPPPGGGFPRVPGMAHLPGMPRPASQPQ
ncbi:MAG TPA: peptidylprolyl isomerase [Polyangiaceae bacterium]|nr:peptidylprolyl isomerase [Polyangiaceae bacterium]